MDWDKIPDIIALHKRLLHKNDFETYVELIAKESLKVGHIPTIDLILELPDHQNHITSQLTKYASYDTLVHVLNTHKVNFYAADLVDVIVRYDLKMFEYLVENVNFRDVQIAQACGSLLDRIAEYPNINFVKMFERLLRKMNELGVLKIGGVHLNNFYQLISETNVTIVKHFVENGLDINFNKFMYYVLRHGNVPIIEYLCSVPHYSHEILELSNQDLSSQINLINADTLLVLRSINPSILKTWKSTCYRDIANMTRKNVKLLHNILPWSNGKRELLAWEKYTVSTWKGLHIKTKQNFQNHLTQQNFCKSNSKTNFLKSILRTRSMYIQMTLFD
jgi:hypothetical protein